MKSSAKNNKAPAQKAAPKTPGRANYLFLTAGVTLLAVSYVVMYAENDPNGFFALYVCPITLVGAYGWILFSLLYRSRST